MLDKDAVMKEQAAQQACDTRYYPDAHEHLRALVAMYGQLLTIEPTDPWRMGNQSLYATVCAVIAEQTGIDKESVQKFCETVSFRA